MKAYRGVDPLDFLGETGKRIVILCDTDHKPLAFQCPTARLHGVAIDPRHGFHVGESGGRFTLGTLAKLGEISGILILIIIIPNHNQIIRKKTLILIVA